MAYAHHSHCKNIQFPIYLLAGYYLLHVGTYLGNSAYAFLIIDLDSGWNHGLYLMLSAVDVDFVCVLLLKIQTEKQTI